MKKLILDLCGGSGAWSQPYVDAGYEVINVTLPDKDVLTWLPDNFAEVYGILSAPPCIMFSLARTTAKTPRDFKGAMKTVSACLNIVWNCRSSPKNKLKFWALENPRGYLRQFLGKPPLTFDPCDYGDAYTKKTDLWGYYKEPRKKRVELNDEQKARCSINSRVLPKTIKGLSARRAITPPGFAQAFFKANK